MKTTIVALICLAGILGTMPVPLKAAETHNWQTATLTGTEQQKVAEGGTRTSNTDASVKDKGDRTDYSRNSTSTTTDNYETYQIYTIEGAKSVYVGSEHLLFPWSKPASVTAGNPVKFSVEKGKLFILDDDGKVHKTTLVKTSLKSAN
jgi:hypothetical protein